MLMLCSCPVQLIAGNFLSTAVEDSTRHPQLKPTAQSSGAARGGFRNVGFCAKLFRTPTPNDSCSGVVVSLRFPMIGCAPSTPRSSVDRRCGPERVPVAHGSEPKRSGQKSYVSVSQSKPFFEQSCCGDSVVLFLVRR